MMGCKAMRTPNYRRRYNSRGIGRAQPNRKIVLVDEVFDEIVTCDLVDILDRLDKLEESVSSIQKRFPSPVAVLLGAIAELTEKKLTEMVAGIRTRIRA